MMQFRYNEIDIIKGICMILVFFNHSILYFPIDYRTLYPLCGYITDVIGSWYMPCFFIASGFLFAKSSKTNKNVIIDKAKRLLVPYLFVCSISMGMKLLMPSFALYGHSGWQEHLHYYFLAGGDRWFLFVLFWIFLIITPIKKYIVNNTFLMLISILVIYTVNELETFLDILPLYYFFHFGAYFVFGFLIRHFYDRFRYVLQKYVILFLILFVCYNAIFNYYFDGVFWDLVLPIVGSLACFSVSVALSECNSGFLGTIVSMIKIVGKYSLPFYVMTGFVLMPARTIIVLKMGLENPWIVIPLVFIVQMALASFAVWICKRYKILRFLMGY